MLHIYYGDGKGKTTSTVGLAIRMVGAGKKVQFIQFLKDGNSSENKILAQLGVTVCTLDMGIRFVNVHDQDCMKKAKEVQQKLFNMMDDAYDCIILDEILDALLLYMLNEDEVYRKINHLKNNCEVCMTGRKASQKFVAMSDYYIKIEKKKHPYDQGIQARKGIEF